MTQIIIALLLSLGQLASVEQWETLSLEQQDALIVGVDTVVN